MKQKTNIIAICSKKPLTEWRGSITIFDGLHNTRPDKEHIEKPLEEISKAICPVQPVITSDKSTAQYYISCLLKEAQLTGKTLEKAKKSGEKATGKMRSRVHVTESALVTLEFDGVLGEDFEGGLKKLEKNGLTYKAFTTYSYGDADKLGLHVRVIVPMDRALGIEEYSLAFNGLNDYFFNGKADPSGSKLYQPQGIRSCHPERVHWAEAWENNHGVVSADALIQIGKSLQPAKESRSPENKFREPDSEKLAKTEKVLEYIDPDIGYPIWLLVLMGIFNETGGSDEGLELAIAWSSKGKKYKGRAEIESKWNSFDRNHENPVTIATLYKIVKDQGVDLKTSRGTADEEFKCLDNETVVIKNYSDNSIAADADSATVDQPVTTDTPNSTSPPSIDDDEEIIEELAAMNPMEYDRIRADKAKELGVQVKTLDDAVKQARKTESKPNNSPFGDIEPWSEPVNPEELLDELSEGIKRYVVLDSEQADTAALWVVHTYLIDVFPISPIAIINAPEKACGKTLLLKILESLCYRPLTAANITPAVVFRCVDLWQPTLLIDEADTFLRDNKELHGLINAGYERGQFVIRNVKVGDSHVPHKFSIYCAKAIAGIALERHLPESTMSRGITLKMRRKRADESVDRMRNADLSAFGSMKSKLIRFVQDYSERLKTACPKLPGELSDRDMDKFEALFAIAECAGDKWLERVTEAALKLSANGETALCPGAELLSDIRDIFHSGEHPLNIPTERLIEALCKDDEAPWKTYNYGKPFTPRQLARLLAPYDIRSRTVRVDKYSTPKGYYAEDFQDAFERYIPAKKK